MSICWISGSPLSENLHQGISIKRSAGLGELEPLPYWGFEDLYHKAGTKLGKTLYVIAERKQEGAVEYFRYSEFLLLEGFRQNRFIEAIESGNVLVDFDARTGHNHGTKFRLKQNCYSSLYESVKSI